MRIAGASRRHSRRFQAGNPAAARLGGTFCKIQKRFIVPAWTGGTFYEIPKTFHCARSGGRNVTQNPKTFCSARRGAPMCAPALVGVSVRTRADTQVRPYGRPERHIKPQKRPIPPYGWLARFTECQKNVPLCPFWRTESNKKYKNHTIYP